MKLITQLLPTLLRLVGWFLDSKVKDAEAKSAFIQMVQRLQHLKIVSTALYQEDVKQQTELNQRHKELNS